MLYRRGLYVLRRVRDCLTRVEKAVEKGDNKFFVEAVYKLDKEISALVRVANSLKGAV